MSDTENTGKGEGKAWASRFPIARIQFLVRFAFLVTLLWVIAGSYFFPLWWNMLFTKELFTPRGLKDAFLPLNIAEMVALLALIIFVNLYVSRSPRFAVLQRWMLSNQSISVVCIAFIFLFQSLSDLHYRAFLADFPSNLSKIGELLNPKPEKDEAPLSQPTLIIYIDKEEIESLYSQHEDELVPAIVTQEIQSSRGVKGALSVKDFIKTEADSSQMQNKITEYRQLQRTPERKLKDLLSYLHQGSLLKRLSIFQGSSDEIKALDSALEAFTKHGVTFDDAKLSSVRDNLFQEGLAKFIADLATTNGLIVVEGDWSIREDGEQYLLTHELVDRVSNPPECCTKVPKTAIPTEYLDNLEGVECAPVTLTVFGSVISTPSQSNRSMKIRALAIF